MFFILKYVRKILANLIAEKLLRKIYHRLFHPLKLPTNNAFQKFYIVSDCDKRCKTPENFIYSQQG